MNEQTNQDGCAHRDDLMSTLYGEATEQEAQNFQKHLNSCAECADDFATFKGIHSSLLEWRAQTVGSVSLIPQRTIEVAQPSALAAIREFLRLSPLWLKGAVAFATVALCALAGLAVFRSSEGPTQKIVATKTEAEIEKLVEARTQERLQTLSKNQQIAQSSTVATTRQPMQAPRRKPSIRTSQLAGNRKTRPLTKEERTQLAADLRLTVTEEEAEIDLLGEGNNRQQD